MHKSASCIIILGDIAFTFQMVSELVLCALHLNLWNLGSTKYSQYCTVPRFVQWSSAWNISMTQNTWSWISREIRRSWYYCECGWGRYIFLENSYFLEHSCNIHYQKRELKVAIFMPLLHVHYVPGVQKHGWL